MRLVDQKHEHSILLISVAAAIAAAGSSAVSLLNPDIYWDVLPPELMVGTVGFDVVSLASSVALLACAAAIHRGRDRLWLPWIGLQGFLLYTYATLAFGFVLTPLYFVYIAILGLSAYALAIFGRSIDPALLRHWQPTRLPRRTMAVVLVIVATMFGLTWTSMLVDAMAGHAEVSGTTVIVLDLAFALPLLALVGVLLFLKRPTGDLLAPGIFGMSAGVTLSVAIGEFVRPLFGESFSLLAAAPYLLPGAVCLAFAVLAFIRVAPAAFPGADASGTPREHA